jgi:hypothetical protein
MTSVYVTVPTTGSIHKLVHFAICKILSDGRYKVRHDCPTWTPYINGLHHCCKDFLNGGEDYWLSLDDDTVPQNNPLDLIDLDCDLIGCPTPIWHNSVPGDRPWLFNVMRRVPEGFRPHEPCDGLQEVDAIGSSAFLVARRVILALKDQQPFMREWLPDGTVGIGGDFSFCDKVRAAGFKIWAHFDYPAEHIQTLPLLEVIRAFAAIRHNPPSPPDATPAKLG